MFRPPGEADSLILQVDCGCPHNRCTFCAMYRGIPWQSRNLEAVARMVGELPVYERQAARIFLADGDVMQRPFEELRELLELLNREFPRLARVSMYANGRSIAAKTDAGLQVLRGLKLHTLYMGLESGDDDVLLACHKAETAEIMVDAALRAQAAGLRMSVMVLLGLGGRSGSQAHAERTAEILNRMQPRLLSALRVIPINGTPLYEQVECGRFSLLSEYEIVAELREMIRRLQLDKCVFRANHTSNIVPLEGRFPQDRQRLLDQLDRLLAAEVLDRQPLRLQDCRGIWL